MTRAFLVASSLALAILGASGSTWADTLSVNEKPVTATTSWETNPRLGNDGTSDLVTFTRRDSLQDGSMSKGDIWYQRLDASGASTGSAVQVTSDAQDNQINDISGDFIVYTAYDSTRSLSGGIMVYQISTTALNRIGSAQIMQEPRIHGDMVVWREGGANAAQVMLYDLSWLATSRDADIIAGPLPPTYNVDIGDRLVVWAEKTNLQLDIVAYIFSDGARIAVTATADTHETEPSTSGSWIVWQAQDRGVSASRIVARNLDTGEERIIADGGVFNFRPSISGDIIAWESMLYGQLDVFLYRISTNETLRVTRDGFDQYLNDAFGYKVAYVDQRSGNEDIYVSFVPPPVANAGPDQTVHVANSVTLDGSGSSDPSGLGSLTYAWSIVSQPVGPLPAELSDPSAVSPTFVPFLDGQYVVELTVTNTIGWTASDTVVVSTVNSAPVADAGPDQLVALPGSTVQLDGTRSYDLDGDRLTYAWAFQSTPPGSQAVLVFSSKDRAHPTFVADVYGTYVVELVVSDNWSSSASDTVSVSFENLPPVASAGLSRSVDVGTTVSLDGSGSSDPNGDALTSSWTLVSFPPGSTAMLANSTSVSPSFIPDREGLYVVQLIVNDGLLASQPSTVQIQAVMTPSAATATVSDLQEAIGTLPVAAFKNGNMRNALNNKLNAIVASIGAGDYTAALEHLENDILGKTDGCANSSPSVPDANDWLKSCGEQATVYPLVMDTIAAVLALM